MINVTKPFLPPKGEYDKLLEGIWERNWLTNNGPLVNELELQLKNYLGINHLLYVGNGTIAIQIALKALKIKGEVITTPFSYVATTSSLVWEGIKPVFVDIDSDSYNMDPSKIEAAITKDTSAILATHVYGNPCDIDAIQEIANKYNLKVIYDAAHCFGTKYKGKSVLEYGDVSTISFHATKLYHTVEGGAVVTNSSELTKEMAFMRNFGHNGPDDFYCVGINGKNSEFHAAMGLVNIKYVDEILIRRKKQVQHYREILRGFKHKEVKINSLSEWNFSYFPIAVPSHRLMLKYIRALEENWIYVRRYFYPALHNLNYVESESLPITEKVEQCVFCLPLYHTLALEEIDFIGRILLRTQNN